MITLDQKSRLETLTQEYQGLLDGGSFHEEISADEQSILDQIVKRFDEIQAFIQTVGETSERTSGQSDIPSDADNRKSNRLEKLKGMQSSIAGLMSSLKSAR